MTKILTLALSAIFCVALAAPVFAAADAAADKAVTPQSSEDAKVDKSAAEADNKAGKEEKAEKAPAAEEAPAAK